MQLGNAAWGLRETPLEQQLAITAAMGLELLELSIAGYDRDYLQLDADEKRIAEVTELFRRYNVRLDCACTGNDFTGKRVIPFCTSSSSGLGESGELLAELAGTGDWQEGMRFRSSASEADVEEWIDSLGL